MKSSFPEWPALAAILVWSSLAAVSGGALAAVSAPALLAIALGAAAVALGGVASVRGGRVTTRAVLLAAAGLGGYHALLFAAFAHAPLLEANLLNYLWPVLTVALAGPLAGERVPRRVLVAAPIGMLGAALVVGLGSAKPDTDAALGYALAAGAALTWATFSNLLKRVAVGPGALALGAGVSAGLTAIYCRVAGVAWPAGPGLAAAVYLGALPMGLATALWEWGIRRGRVAVAGTLAYLTPVLSTLTVAAVLGRPLTLGAALGGGLVLASAILASRR